MRVDKRAESHTKDLRVITDDAVSLAIHDYGPTTAQHTVVFLHGLCLSRASWAGQIAYLSRRYGPAVRLISYDHRGHGRSGLAPMGTYQIDRLAEDLAQVLAATQISGPLTLVGHSMGGMAALTYLTRGARPIEPHGLVLVATAAGKLAERGLGRLLATPITEALPRLVEHTPDRLVRTMVGPLRATLRHWRPWAHSATVAAAAATALTTTPVSTAVGFLSNLRTYDRYTALASIRAQTIVISGGMDPLIPPVHARDLTAQIPGAQHLHLPAAGHMLPQQASHVINNAICRTIAIEHCQSNRRDRHEPVTKRHTVSA